MNLYITTRCGNLDEGPNGEDANFLIKASSDKETEQITNDLKILK